MQLSINSILFAHSSLFGVSCSGFFSSLESIPSYKKPLSLRNLERELPQCWIQLSVICATNCALNNECCFMSTSFDSFDRHQSPMEINTHVCIPHECCQISMQPRVSIQNTQFCAMIQVHCARTCVYAMQGPRWAPTCPCNQEQNVHHADDCFPLFPAVFPMDTSTFSTNFGRPDKIRDSLPSPQSVRFAPPVQTPKAHIRLACFSPSFGLGPEPT